MDQTNPVELVMLLFWKKVLDFLQNKVHIRRIGKKADINNETKATWRLNIDVSIHRESVRR
jgi:hypothetical protein